MRPLIIDENAKKQISQVIDYAKRNIISQRELEFRDRVKTISVGDNPQRICNINLGYRCCYSIEEQPIGLCSHLSVSADDNKLPSPAAVELIKKEFGMSEEDVYVYIENEVNAINVISKIDLLSEE